MIPIADMVDRNGSYLLLYTQTEKITSYSIMANNIGGNWEEHKRLADSEKWKAFPTMPVKQFFERWKMLYEKLVWMVVPPVDDSHGDRGIYFTRADNAVEEAEMLKRDGTFDVEIEDDVTEVSLWWSRSLLVFVNHFDRESMAFTKSMDGLGALLTERRVRLNSESIWRTTTNLRDEMVQCLVRKGFIQAGYRPSLSSHEHVWRLSRFEGIVIAEHKGQPEKAWFRLTFNGCFRVHQNYFAFL